MTEPLVQEFRIGQSKARHGLIVAGVAILAALGTLLFADESVADRNWIVALLLVVGLGVAVHAWRMGQTAGAHLRIDDAGVRFREWGASVPWSDIEDVYQSGSRMQPFITIKIRDPESFLEALPEDEARAIRRNRLWKSPELRIPYSAVEASRDEILAAIDAGMRSHGSVAERPE